MPAGDSIESEVFELGGHPWQILLYPGGVDRVSTYVLCVCVCVCVCVRACANAHACARMLHTVSAVYGYMRICVLCRHAFDACVLSPHALHACLTRVTCLYASRYVPEVYIYVT